jgi:transposase
MNREDILKIPELAREGKSVGEIATIFGVSERTICSWSAKLREEKIKVPFKRGRRPLQLK